MKVPADVYVRSERVYRGLDELTYPFHRGPSCCAADKGNAARSKPGSTMSEDTRYSTTKNTRKAQNYVLGAQEEQHSAENGDQHQR
jgi:hypothetical protein